MGIAVQTARMRRARREAGLRQSDLAKRCGCSIASIGRVERGQLRPSLELLARIAKAVGVTAEALCRDGEAQTDQKASRGPRTALEAEILSLVGHLPAEVQQHVLSYVKGLQAAQAFFRAGVDQGASG